MKMTRETRKNLKKMGVHSDRGMCECKHDWWDHAFSPVFPCQARSCDCRRFVRVEAYTKDGP